MILRKLIFILVISITFLTAANVDTLRVISGSMEDTLSAIVVVPDSSKLQGNLPVVYLLHGYSGNYTDWSGKMDLRPLAERFQVIIVCPEGGYDSWYLDSPLQEKSQYESHIINELIPLVDSSFPTSPQKSARAITGLSMGGHGALYLAIRHSNLFTAVGSMSGAMDLVPLKDKYGIAQKIGPYEEYAERWTSNSITHMVDQAKQAELQLLLDCGIEDIFIESNREVHQKLLFGEIPHTYVERPGGHSWNYWTNALPDHLMFFNKIFGPTTVK